MRPSEGSGWHEQVSPFEYLSFWLERSKRTRAAEYILPTKSARRVEGAESRDMLCVNGLITGGAIISTSC